MGQLKSQLPQSWRVVPCCHGSKSKARTPSEPPNPTTKIGSKMSREFTYQPKWDPKTVFSTTAVYLLKRKVAEKQLHPRCEFCRCQCFRRLGQGQTRGLLFSSILLGADLILQGPPARCPSLPTFLGEGSPPKINYRQKRVPLF